MLIQIILIAVFLSFSAEVCALQKTDQQLNSALKELELQIDILTHKDRELRLKFSRLFQTNLANEQNDTTLEDLSIMPSISIPYKDNFYYTMMIRKKQDYYTLRGDLIYSDREKSTLVATARSDYTYFVQILKNKTLVFKQLTFIKKQPQLDVEIALNLQQFSEFKVDRVFVVNPSNRVNFLTVDLKNGEILCFDKYGLLFNRIQTEGEIFQVEKVNNFLVVLTKKSFFYLNINRNYTKVDCVCPQDSLQSFVFEETIYKSVYAIKNDVLFQYDLGNYCRPIKSYPLPENSSVFMTSQLMLIESRKNHYMINYTEGILRPLSLPVSDCEGQMKIEVSRKLISQYIISHLCLRENNINIAHILVDMDSNGPEIADFSKFRIPLLLFSFGVIIFVTVKNKKKENQSQQSQQLKEVLIGRKTEYKVEQTGSSGEIKREGQIECVQTQMRGSKIEINSLKIKSN